MSTPQIGQPHLFEPPPPVTLTLRDRFLIPPFSVLDARAGYWQERKRAWLSLGIKSEHGRDENLLNFSKTVEIPTGNTSIFDPVLCELAYRWFAPEGGVVVDPFAGGSVRGIVAAALGRRYQGVDLSLPQVESNYQQLPEIRGILQSRSPDALWAQDPIWEHGDARNLLDYVAPGTADLIFTCPPYYDLEVYSDNPYDLSAAGTYAEFRAGYQECLARAAEALAPNRFALIVVGEVRDKRSGHYVGLVPDTIRAFEDAGLIYYNEAILVTSVGSLPIRTSKAFGPGRKLGKSHQNLLCFVKGSWREACAACAMPEEVAVEYGGATWRTDGSVQTQGEARSLADIEIPF